jgi:glycosyltransferase involved in cell wall biosynthesis
MLNHREIALPARSLRQRLRNLHYRIFLAVAAAIERIIYRRPGLRATAAVSGGTKDDLIRFYGLAPESVAVVPNAVDDRVRLGPEDRRKCREEIRARHRIREESIVLLFVGAGDWKRKGLLAVLETLAILKDLDLHLIVVGREDVPYYEKEALRLGVGDRVVFAGFRKDIERYYASADIFVYPSAYEAFSLVSLEAAGASLPLLVSRINGTEDLVHPGVNGFFIEREPSDIAAKIRLLASDPVLRGRMAAASAETSRAFSRQAVAERILGLVQARTALPEPVPTAQGRR